MDELGGKIISVIVGAVIIFLLQASGVHKLVASIFGGVSSTVLEKEITDSSKREDFLFWKSIDKCGTSECYKIYLEKYPYGSFEGLAKEQLKLSHANNNNKEKDILIIEKNNENIKKTTTKENKFIKINENLWQYGRCKIKSKKDESFPIPDDIVKDHNVKLSNDKEFLLFKKNFNNYKNSITGILLINTCEIKYLKGKGISERADNIYIDRNSQYVFLQNQHRNIGVYSRSNNWKLIKIIGQWSNDYIADYLMIQSPDNKYLFYTFIDSWGIYDINKKIDVKKYNDRNNEPKLCDEYSWGRDIKTVKFFNKSPEILIEISSRFCDRKSQRKNKYIYNYDEKTYKKYL